MQELMNWSAKRAGGRITVTAVDYSTKKIVKIVGVDTIEAQTDGHPIATDKDGKRYLLTNWGS